jgi:hypothetical protein
MGLAVDVGKLSDVAKPILTVEMIIPAMTKKGLVSRRPYYLKTEKTRQQQGKWEGRVGIFSVGSGARRLDRKVICRSVLGLYTRSTKHARTTLNDWLGG